MLMTSFDPLRGEEISGEATEISSLQRFIHHTRWREDILQGEEPQTNEAAFSSHSENRRKGD